MNKLGFHAVLAAVSGLSLAGVAGANSITATLDNVTPAQIVTISYNGNNLGQAYAGALNWHGQESNDAGLSGKFTTFCIDLTQDVYLGSTYAFNIASPLDAPNPLPPTAPPGSTGMGATNLQHLENLYALEFDSIGQDNDRGAAFQLAIWEMLFDTSETHDVSTGQFAVSGTSAGVITLANQFVSATLSSDSLTFHNELLALTSPTAQDQLFVGDPLSAPPQFAAPPVPNPAAAIGAIPLLGGLAIFRRHKRRNHL